MRPSKPSMPDDPQVMAAFEQLDDFREVQDTRKALRLSLGPGLALPISSDTISSSDNTSSPPAKCRRTQVSRLSLPALLHDDVPVAAPTVAPPPHADAVHRMNLLPLRRSLITPTDGELLPERTLPTSDVEMIPTPSEFTRKATVIFEYRVRSVFFRSFGSDPLFFLRLEVNQFVARYPLFHMRMLESTFGTYGDNTTKNFEMTRHDSLSV
jgi:hypothetical protein